MPWLVHGFQKPQVLWKSSGLQDQGTYSVRYQQTIKGKVNHYYIDHTTQRQQLLWKTGRQISWPDHKGQEVLTQNSSALGTREHLGNQTATTFGRLKGLDAQRASESNT